MSTTNRGVIEEIKKHINIKFNEVDKLREENKKLRECVEFYADVASWYDMYGEISKNGSAAIEALKEIDQN